MLSCAQISITPTFKEIGQFWVPNILILWRGIISTKQIIERTGGMVLYRTDLRFTELKKRSLELILRSSALCRTRNYCSHRQQVDIFIQQLFWPDERKINQRCTTTCDENRHRNLTKYTLDAYQYQHWQDKQGSEILCFQNKISEGSCHVINVLQLIPRQSTAGSTHQMLL